jgi:hypothetical protein
VPLPPQVAEALRTVPDGVEPNPLYFFGAVTDFRRVPLRLATQFQKSLKTGWLGEAGRFSKALLPTHAEGHICR